MARYQMKQKWLSFGDDYVVKDAAGNEIFYIDGKVFTLRTTLLVQDMGGRELATIQKKILSWGPTYEIYRGGALAAVVKKSLFTFFRCEFTVDVPGPDDLVADGSFSDYEYVFRRARGPVASVSKRFFSWTDSYGIDIDDREDPVLIIASAVVIDQCCHEEK